MTIAFRKLFIFTSVVALAVVLSGCKSNKASQTDGESGANSATSTESKTDKGTAVSGDSKTITYTDSGFEPATLTMKEGESVTWKNSSSKKVQIGSDDHPTHSLNRSLTANKFVIELEPGESETVQITVTGAWGYHDHLRPSMTGTIDVP